MSSSSFNQNYFKDVLLFLKKYTWLYNYANVDILNTIYFQAIPNDWIASFKLFCRDNDNFENLLTKLNEQTKITQFSEFITQIQKLNVRDVAYDFQSCNTLNSTLINRVKNEKKRHEIECLAKVVHDVCQKNDIDIIIDVGSGLGYVSFLLHENFNYKILAVEGNSNFVSSAIKYQKENHPASLSSVKFLNYFITEKSLDDLMQYLEEHFRNELKNKPKICIIGLHACADLSVTIMNLFANIPFSGVLVIMPCCYHRLSTVEENGQFSNFPLSNALKQLHEYYGAKDFLKVPFMRLACQQTVNKCNNISRDEMHNQSVLWMMRAILQNVAEEEKCVVKRLKRKSGKMNKFNIKSSNVAEEYVKNIICNTHKIVHKDEKIERLIDETVLKEKFIEKWLFYQEQCDVLEFLSTFQTSIQAICENVVLLDRVEFFREKGLQCSRYKITDDRISPRCYALYALKI